MVQAGPWGGGPWGWHHRPPSHTSHCSSPTDYVPLWVYVFITGVAILLVGSAILLILCMTWRLSGKGPDRIFLDKEINRCWSPSTLLPSLARF